MSSDDKKPNDVIGPLTWKELCDLVGGPDDLDAMCVRCGCFFEGPSEGCPNCDPPEMSAGNTMTVHPAGDPDGCGAPDCPYCCQDFVEEEDLPSG